MNQNATTGNDDTFDDKIKFLFRFSNAQKYGK